MLAFIYEPPIGDTEERLAAIWQELLGVSPIGRHDDFFELGGHSLLATQVMSRVRDAFQVELPLRSLFEGPTIADQAEAILSADPGERAAVEQRARLLVDLTQMSDDDVERMLAGGSPASRAIEAK